MARDGVRLRVDAALSRRRRVHASRADDHEEPRSVPRARSTRVALRQPRAAARSTCSRAMLEQDGGVAAPLLQKAGADVAALCAAPSASKVEGFPRVSGGAEPGLVAPHARGHSARRGRGQAAEGRLRLGRALPPRDGAARPRDPGRCFEQHGGVTYEKLLAALASVRGSQRITDQDPEGKFQALEKYCRDLTEAARKGKTRPGHRARRRDPPRDAGALAPDEEQPRAHRRAGRRQDGDRRGHRAAHRPRRRARVAEEQAARARSTWARSSPARSSAASSRSA